MNLTSINEHIPAPMINALSFVESLRLIAVKGRSRLIVLIPTISRNEPIKTRMSFGIPMSAIHCASPPGVIIPSEKLTPSWIMAMGHQSRIGSRAGLRMRHSRRRQATASKRLNRGPVADVTPITLSGRDVTPTIIVPPNGSTWTQTLSGFP